MINPLRIPIVLLVLLLGLALFVHAAHRRRQGEPLLDRLGRSQTELPLRHDDRASSESFPTGRLAVDAPPTTWETSLSSREEPPTPVPTWVPSTPLPRATDAVDSGTPSRRAEAPRTSTLGRIGDQASSESRTGHIEQPDRADDGYLGAPTEMTSAAPRATVGFSPESAQRVRTPRIDDDLTQMVKHRICDGDTLKRLAERYLGDGARSLEIFAANRDVLMHPDLLPVGETIRIPPR